MSENPPAGEHPSAAARAHEHIYPQASSPGAVSYGESFEQVPHENPPRQSAKIAWDAILVWSVVVAAVAIVGVLTVFLVLGILELIAVVSPILLAVLLVWVVFLTLRLVRLERNLGAGSK